MYLARAVGTGMYDFYELKSVTTMIIWTSSALEHVRMGEMLTPHFPLMVQV